MLLFWQSVEREIIKVGKTLFSDFTVYVTTVPPILFSCRCKTKNKCTVILDLKLEKNSCSYLRIMSYINSISLANYVAGLIKQS